MTVAVIPVRRMLLGAVAVLSLSACTTWGASTRRPNEALQPVEGKRVGRMFVRVLDGSEKELWNVRIGVDSMVGMQLNTDGTRERVAFARADLREVTLRRFDGGKTATLLAGIALTLVALSRAVMRDLFAGSAT